MDSSRLTTAGWVYLLSIPLTVIAIVFNIWSEQVDVIPAMIVQTVLAIIILAMTLFVLRTWKGMLNAGFDFHQADGPLNALIVMAYVVAAGRVINTALGTSAIEWLSDIAFMAAGFISAAIAIGFAVRLLRLEDSLGGYRKVFCFLSITGNVCALTIILIPVAILATLAEQVVAAMLFFSMAHRAREITYGERIESGFPPA